MRRTKDYKITRPQESIKSNSYYCRRLSCIHHRHSLNTRYYSYVCVCERTHTRDIIINTALITRYTTYNTHECFNLRGPPYIVVAVTSGLATIRTPTHPRSIPSELVRLEVGIMCVWYVSSTWAGGRQNYCKYRTHEYILYLFCFVDVRSRLKIYTQYSVRSITSSGTCRVYHTKSILYCNVLIRQNRC